MLRRTFLLTVSGATLSAIAHADTVDDVLAALTSARASLKSLVAPFTQERVLGLLANTVTSKGELTMLLPDRLRWELFAPDEIIYWVGPEGIAYKSPNGSGKLPAGSAGAMGAVLEDLMILLGGDLTKLKSRYDIQAEKSSAGATVILVPKQAAVAKVLKKLTIQIDSDLISPKKIVLEEPSGDSSTISFSGVKKNTTVDPSKMKP